MTSSRPLTGREAARQLVHFGVGSLALTFPWLDRPQAAIFCAGAIAMNIVILPRLPVTKLLFRSEESLFEGIVLYPTVVLLLVLVLPDFPALAAGAWGILAAGDSASCLVGRAWGKRRLPHNDSKTWMGVLGFLIAAGPWSAFLLIWCGVEVHTAWILAGVASICAALVESLPLPLDDNISVGAAAGASLVATVAIGGFEVGL